MAFTKRTWLARIGTGLNKFIIGEKDANDKQTLVNSPDSVTQQGDVISADNLNDLEGRIETSVNANESAINGMKLTKIWENPDPSVSFPITTINLGDAGNDIVIEYAFSASAQARFMKWIPSSQLAGDATISSRLEYNGIYSSTMVMCTRIVMTSLSQNSELLIAFENATLGAFIVPQSTSGQINGYWDTNNERLIPLYIYKVGDIYNTEA